MLAECGRASRLGALTPLRHRGSPSARERLTPCALCDLVQVIGFARVKADAPSAAEASGWISVGDTLLAVNDKAVTGMSLSDVSYTIIKGSCTTPYSRC